MKTYEIEVQRDRRLVILRLLRQTDGYAANESLIKSGLAALGHKVSRDLVKTELGWLEEQGLLTIETVSDIMVATLTHRGADVAAGLSNVEGVKRPSPK